MYSKCASMVEASEIFKETYRYIVSFTAMINGYAVDGTSKDSDFNLFFLNV